MATVLTWFLSPDPTAPVLPVESSAATGADTTGDLGLFWSNGSADLAIVDNDIARDAGLRTAVLLSLFTDRRAEDGDVLLDDAADRRGWWADELSDEPGDKFGSRLWQLGRAKPAEWLARAGDYAREALDWLVEDKVAERIEAVASVPALGLAVLEIEIFKPQQRQPTRFKFSGAWQAEEN